MYEGVWGGVKATAQEATTGGGAQQQVPGGEGKTCKEWVVFACCLSFFFMVFFKSKPRRRRRRAKQIPPTLYLLPNTASLVFTKPHTTQPLGPPSLQPTNSPATHLDAHASVVKESLVEQCEQGVEDGAVGLENLINERNLAVGCWNGEGVGDIRGAQWQ